MKQRFTYFLLVAATLVGQLLFPLTAQAAGASISLVANRATVPAGGSLIVAIYMNGGGTPVYGVQSDLNFPSSKLQYVGFSAGGSTFEISAANGGSDGFASIARGTTNPVSGSGLVGTVTFRALASSGSAAITIAGSSALAKGDGGAIPFSSGNVSVNFGAVAAAPAKGAAPESAPVVEAPKDTTAPTISEIKFKDLQPNSGTITWKTNEPSNSVVEYGLDNTYGLSASVAAATTNHEVILNSTFLTPKTVFHYRVKSTDAAGNVQTSPDQTLPIPGIPVTIVVRAADGTPQAGAMVTLDNATGITDEKGSVTLPSGTGNKTIITSFNGVTMRKPVTIDKTSKKSLSYQLASGGSSQNRWMYSTVALAVVVLLLLLVDTVIFGSRFFAKTFRIKMHAPAFAHATPAVPERNTEPVLAKNVETQVLPVLNPDPAIAPAVIAAPRYTTIRPHDLDLEPKSEPSDELDIAASASVPLSQLVNNIPQQSNRPVLPKPIVDKMPLDAEHSVTKIAIKHFNEPDSTSLDLPTRVEQIMLSAPVPAKSPAAKKLSAIKRVVVNKKAIKKPATKAKATKKVAKASSAKKT